MPEANRRVVDTLNEWFDVECVIDIACCDALYYINHKMYFYEREFFEVEEAKREDVKIEF